MKTSKFFFSTLIAASAMTATAYAASISYDEYSDSQKSNLQLAYSFESNTPEVNNVSLGEFGNVSDGVGVANGDNGRPWTTGVNNGGLFSGGAFTISFDLIAFDASNWTDALSLYTNGTTSGDSNSIQLQKNNNNELMVYTSGFTDSNVSGDASNFKLGSIDDLLGKTLTLVFDGTSETTKTLTGYVDGVAITDTVTFTYADGVTPSTALTGFQFGAAFGGGRASTSVTVDNVALWNTALSAGDVAALIVVPSDFTWAGGASGNWTDTSWTSGEDSDQALSGVPNVTFNDSVTMTASGNVSLNSLTVATDKTLNLAGAGTVSTESLNNSGTISIDSDSTLNTTSVTALGTIIGSGKIAFGTGDVTPGTNFTAGTWTGTVAFENVTKNDLKVSDFGNANSTIEFNNFTGYFDEAENGANDVVKSSIVTNVTIVGTLNINNGWSNGSLVFDGNVTGDTFKFTKPNNGNPTQEFVFNKMVNLTNVNLSGGSATVTFNGAATVGSLTLSADAVAKVSGSLELTTREGSDFEGTLEVLAGGTLTLSGHDALGYNNGGLDSGVISLQGNNSTEKASLVINDSDGNGNNSMTLSKTLELKGYSTVSATEGRSFNSWNGKIKASGIENEISSTIGLRKELIVDVEDGGKLIISGNMLNGQDPVDGGLLKSGSGELTLSGNNTYTHGTTIEAGTLVAGSNSALGTNSVKISGGKLEVASGVTVSNAIEIVLNSAYTAEAAIQGAGTLASSAITVSGDLDALITLQRTVAQQYEYQLLSSSLTTDGVTVTLSSELQTAIENKGWTYDYDTTSGTLTLTIPEPSAFGLLAGVGALALVASRRRRSRR